MPSAFHRVIQAYRPLCRRGQMLDGTSGPLTAKFADETSGSAVTGPRRTALMLAALAACRLSLLQRRRTGR